MDLLDYYNHFPIDRGKPDDNRIGRLLKHLNEKS